MTTYVGERSLYNVFDEYLARVNGQICERLGLHASANVVRAGLRQVGRELWLRKARSLKLEKFVVLIDGISLDQLNWEVSRSKPFLDEGLLVFRDWHGDGEVVSFTYDLLAGYLVGDELVSSDSEAMRVLLTTPSVVDQLFSTGYQRLHPLFTDIRRSIAALLPGRVGLFLHECSDNRVARDVSVDALFEMTPSEISPEAVAFLRNFFIEASAQRRIGLLHASRTTAFHPSHPLNARFWDEALQQLNLVERDLSWTEFVREARDWWHQAATVFGGECVPGTASALSPRFELFGIYATWVLSSTVRPLRDRITWALYRLGRVDPTFLFDRTLESLHFNDPYVGERTLAASYGVAMALLDPNHDSNHSVALLSFARSVFDSSFALGSDRSLDHYLARDYARHTIQAALLHNRDLLNSAEREQITLPLASNHVDAWGQEVDRDRENYREGNAPVHMDFENYTLGRLVRNRRNYDMEHEGHSWLREKLFWRIYDLGYSLDSFGDIDATIARSRWYPTDEPERTDRYGKKYSWIAFWELATHQMDRGLLDDLQEQYSRMSDVDIDPSFPRPAQEREGMKIDLIGDSSTSTEQWIVEGPIPDVRSIDRDEGGDMGPGAWRLIWGCAYQEDLALKRRAFLNYRTYFTRNPLTEEQLKGLNASTQWGANFPDAPADLYTFAGEMPWCETFPYNDWTTLAWEVGRETVEVPELAGLLVGHETNQTSDLTMVEQIVWAEADVLPTARTNQWESYHSTIVSDRSIDVPCRQLCDFARLHGRPQTYDFFDQNGERASSVVRWGDRWKNGGTATYVREDILERFIESNGFALLTLLTGDRSFHADDDHERTAFGAEAQYVQNYVRVWTEAS